MIRRLRREEGGWALMGAMTLLMICGGIGMAAASTVDKQQVESGKVRTRETAFNLAEGALNAQIYRISQRWPGKGADGSNPSYGPYLPCDQTTTSPDCPDAAMMSELFRSVDTRAGATWRTSVHDNASPSLNYYSDVETLAQPGYDANGDGRLWVRSRGEALGRKRTLVALVRIETRQEDVPRSALLAGSLDMTNNGNKVIIDATGDAQTPALVAVRCDKETTYLCVGQPVSDMEKIKHLENQISPNVIQDDYGLEPAMPADVVARLQARAIADGTWYATCPSKPPQGAVVWIDSGNCSYTGKHTLNSPENPGIIIQRTGTLALGGTINFYGVVYHLNEQQTTDTVVRLFGNATVHGGVIVEGMARVEAGSSKENIKVLERAFSSVRSYTTAGIIQNTWREIHPTG